MIEKGIYWAWPATPPDVGDMEREAKRSDTVRDKSKVPPQMPKDRRGMVERLKRMLERLVGRRGEAGGARR